MKRSILTLLALGGLLSFVPASSQAHDSHEDYRSDVHSLWEWYGHLRDEAQVHGGRHAREGLEDAHDRLKRLDEILHGRDIHADYVQRSIDRIRDELREVNKELHWHGEIHHRPGFTIEIR